MTEFTPETLQLKTQAIPDGAGVISEFDYSADRLALPLATRLIAMAQMMPSHRVLDVGCGTGIVTVQAAKWSGHEGKVMGIDSSERMLAAAAAKASQAGVTNRVEFWKMDADALRLKQHTFDTVLSMFALRRLLHPRVALREMYRVLRPGGKLVVAVDVLPPVFSFDGIVHRASGTYDRIRAMTGLQLTAPVALDNLVRRRLQAPAPTSDHPAWSNTNAVLESIREAGFTRIKTEWVGNHLTVDSPEEFWSMQRSYSAIARRRLDLATPAQVLQLRHEFLQSCRTMQQRGGQLVYPIAAFYLSAQRPEV